MIIPKFACYMKFERNTSKIKRNGELVERKVMRFDLSLFAGYWTGTDKLKTSKGKMFFNFNTSDRNPNRKNTQTTPEYYIQMNPNTCKKCFNLSGLRLMMNTEQDTWVCCGEPSQLEVLRTKDRNPLYEEKDDGFIFIVDRNFGFIEMFVIAGGRPMIDAYRKGLTLGKFDNELKLMREAATTI